MRYPLFAGLMLLSLLKPVSVYGSGTVYEQEQVQEIMGAPMGAKVTTSTTARNQTISTVNLQALGKGLQALFALTNAPNTVDGVAYTEVYSFGKRVFADSRYVNVDGAQITVGLAPTQVRVPFVMYPVGPVMVQVDGGARFQANLSVSNMTNISFPIQHSEPGVQLSAVATAAGFAEGYAKLFLIRAGVGGEVALVDGRLDVNTKYNLEEQRISVTVNGILEFLKGRIYAFADLFGLFAWGWVRIIDHDLYNWNGYCYATENLQCPGQ